MKATSWSILILASIEVMLGLRLGGKITFYKIPLSIKKCRLKKCNQLFSLHSSHKTLTDCIKLNEHYIDQASSLIADAFPYDAKHSWARALELPENNLKPYLTTYLKDNIHRSYGISISNDTCVNTGSNNEPNQSLILSGIVVSEVLTIGSMIDDLMKHHDTNSSTDYNAYGAIDGILNECTRIFQHELFHRGYNDYNLKYGYISWIATNMAYRGKGFASSLISKIVYSLQNTEECSLVAAYCVSPQATNVFLRQGFSVWGKVPYNSFEYKGRIPFYILPNEVSIVVKTFV